MKALVGRGKSVNLVSAVLLVAWMVLVSIAAESIGQGRELAPQPEAAGIAKDVVEQLDAICALPALRALPARTGALGALDS